MEVPEAISHRGMRTIGGEVFPFRVSTKTKSLSLVLVGFQFQSVKID